MKDAYSIGKFRFDSYREYREALDDVEKIRYISENTDINEPGMAQRLYNLVRQGKITFKSVIGTDYMLYLSDIMMEEMDTGHKKKKEKKNKERSIPFPPRQIVGVLCMIGALAAFLIFSVSEYRDRQKVKELENMKAEQEMAVVADWISGRVSEELKKSREEEERHLVAQRQEVKNEVYAADLELTSEEPEPPEEPQEPEILPEYRDMYQRNSDMAGWLSIGGTQIDYPVMQTESAESDYYLHHNFEGQEDINGSLFADARNNLKGTDSNVIIYGHNMKSGMMFGGLKQYLEKDYWKEHRLLTFNTLYERNQYEIVAVCLSKVAYQNEEGLRYYNYLNAENEAEFQAYLDNINEWKVYDEPVELTMEDELLTLSTCNNYTEDGRLFLVARKVRE